MNRIQIVKSDNKFHVFDIRDGQTVGALAARDFETIADAVAWCEANYPITGSWNSGGATDA